MTPGTPTMIYVDAFNLYYGALKGTPYRWLDLEALFRNVFPNNQIVGIRYFTARVTAQAGNPDQPLRQQLYLRALATLRLVSIIEGHYLSKTRRLPLARPHAFGRRFVDVIVDEEKGSDVNLATHLLLDAFKGSFDCAIVVSGDSDLATPITMVRQEFKKTVGVLLPQCQGSATGKPPRKAAKLRQVATFFRDGIRQGVLAASQFPATLTDTDGTFRKPATW